MPLRNDHEMPVIVGIAIKDHDVMRGPEENEVAFVFRVPQKGTKKTAGTFSGARAQVRPAPRGPHQILGSLGVHGFLGMTTK